MSRFPRITLVAGAVAVLAGAGLASELSGHAAAATARSGHTNRVASLPGFQIGVSHSLASHAWLAYYDAHKDSYINTDVSNKSQATSLGINYAPILAHSLGATSPMYFVKEATH